jgi:UDP-GlcNAc3NAcA epimerase
MRILTVVGARPQFIKLAAVSRMLREIPGVREVVVHTGQHYDPEMSDVFFRELEIAEPAHRLAVGSGGHGAQTGRMLEAVERVIESERPDRVLVYGDTNSTLAGALAAAKLHVPVAHVEAGLRSRDRRMPEEVNRVLTDHLSDLLFAPTDAAVTNLAEEGITSGVHQVGDVMYDAALHFGARAEAESRVLDKLDLAEGEYLLATVHRPSTTDDPVLLRGVARVLGEAARALPVVLPLHPRTRLALEAAGVDPGVAPGVRVIPPAGYLDMMRLERGARLVLTDSGGVQKEAFFHGVPCVTLRDSTEWGELVDCGWNTLADPALPDAAVEAVRAALARGVAGLERPALYGGGRAAEQIAELLGSPSAPVHTGRPLTAGVRFQ